MLNTSSKSIAYLVLLAFIGVYAGMFVHLIPDSSEDASESCHHCECDHNHDAQHRKLALEDELPSPTDHQDCICSVFDFQETTPQRRRTTVNVQPVVNEFPDTDGLQGFRRASSLARIYDLPDDPHILSPHLPLLSTVIIIC